MDVAVIGTGFGGLGAALSLAERGARVVVFEALNYPGGCASTFTRSRARFESGATLFSGFGEGELFAQWIARYGLDVPIDFLDPVVSLRIGGRRRETTGEGFARGELRYEVPQSRAAHVERFVAFAQERWPHEAAARAARVRALFAEQERVADTLWELFASPGLLPPFGARELLVHLGRAPRYLPLLPWIGRPLVALLEKHRLDDFLELRAFLDAVSQITVQAGIDEAEAPFAMATMDYYFRGTGHVRGGVGTLARELVRAIEGLGGEVRFADRVKGLERRPGGWRVLARKGAVEAKAVVANLLPQDLRALLPENVRPRARLAELERAVATGWGAAMRYAVLDPEQLRASGVGEGAHHFELVADVARPLREGNHLFCSLSHAREARAPEGGRTLTISTHVPFDTRAERDEARYFAAVQRAMSETLAQRAPELAGAIRWDMTGSPRTFARFTGRHRGLVGGVPRRAGWQNYRHLWPAAVADDVYLVGDSVFPGQSTLATALGGVKLAAHLEAQRGFPAPARAAAPAPQA